MIVVEDFLDIFPEFAEAKPARIQFCMDGAVAQISEKYWRHLYQQGVYYLTAHLLFMRYGKDGTGINGGKPAQEKSSISAGALSVGYASASSGFGGDTGTYALSRYGQEYLNLLALIQPTGMVI